jgi:thiaminase
MFRTTQVPSSGSYIQYLTKIAANGSIVQVVTCVASVMAAYCHARNNLQD